MSSAIKSSIILSLACLAFSTLGNPIHAAVRQSTPSSSSTTSTATTATATTTPACTPGRLSQPTMYSLYPTEPDRAEPAVTELHVQMLGNVSRLEQLAVFPPSRGIIPADAKFCTLRWVQAAIADRHFTVKDSGLVSALQLSSSDVPSEGVSAAGVAPLVEDAVARGNVDLHPDFTAWDTDEFGEYTHTAGSVDCSGGTAGAAGEAGALAFRVKIDGRNGGGHLYLGQDEKNGLVIDYGC
ncbi:hypothetical protein F4778DRAFT_783976 [Xylariomycetidae sp. FL2044]|nr:hypothetical protein F4778DRAFT_783976 [Xylariomycetidae sp. FL2044]